MKITYLKKVMDGRTLKVLYWHVITWVHLIVSDDSFKCPPSITLVQYQVRRTLGFLWRVGLVRSFCCKRREVFRLDGWSSLDGWSGLGYQVHCRSVQVYRCKRELWNLWRRSLARLLFLGTSTSRKVTKVHRAGYTLPLSSLDARLMDDQGSDIVQDLYILFTLNTTCNAFPFIFLHCGHPQS